MSTLLPVMEMTTPAMPRAKPVPFFHFTHEGEQYTVHMMTRKDANPVVHMPEDIHQPQPIKRHSIQLSVQRHVKSANPCGELIPSGGIHVLVDEFADYASASIEQVLAYEDIFTWPELMVNLPFQPLLVWVEQLVHVPTVQQVVVVPKDDIEYEWDLL